MIPSEQNDRLLELAGWCVHEWEICPERPSTLHPNGSMTWYMPIHRCTKCDKQRSCSAEVLETVGDGHVMTLGEMVRLALTQWGCEICISPNVVEVWHRGVSRCEVVDSVDDIEKALASILVHTAAIIAAVEGAK